MPNSVPQSASLSLSVALIGGESNGMAIEGMYSETTSCRKRPTQSRLRPLTHFDLSDSWILLLAIGIFIWLLIGCDTDQTVTPPIRHTVGISELHLTNLTLEPGGTATITATFDYSGDKADLIFGWEASSGQIVGDASSVTYVASNTPGTHTITLQLTDGFVMAEHSVTVEVLAAQSLLVDSDAYWTGDGETLVLRYQVNVTQIIHQPVILRYNIVQDEAKAGAFLNVEVNGTLLVEEEAIGEVDPAEGISIIGEVDASKIITGLGTYEIILTLVVVNPVERGWLLRKAELIGAEGSSVQP